MWSYISLFPLSFLVLLADGFTSPLPMKARVVVSSSVASPVAVRQGSLYASTITPLFQKKLSNDDYSSLSKKSKLQRLFQRFDTVKSAELDDAQMAGLIPQKIKDMHNPKTYFLLGIVGAFKYKWMPRTWWYWFAMAFCIKW